MSKQKNETTETKQSKKRNNENSDKKESPVKAKKQPAKKSAADTGKTDETSQDVQADVSKTVDAFIYRRVKGEHQVTGFPRNEAIRELEKKYPLDLINKKFDEFGVLASETAYFSTNKQKLENLDTENLSPEMPEHIETKIINDESVTPEDFFEPTYELDAEFTVSDPNQKLYDDFREFDEFAHSLNKSETALVQNLMNGNKFVANFGLSETKTWNSVQTKYKKFSEEMAEKAVNDFARNDDAPENVGVNLHKGELDENGQEPLENFRKVETALVKTEDVIHGEIEIADNVPLNEGERKRLEELKAEILDAKQAFEHAPFRMMNALIEIRNGNLHRESGKSLAEFASDEFGITPQYASNMIQSAEFRLVLAEIGTTPLALAESVQATQRWLRDTNKIAQILNMPKSDFEQMKPIISEVAEIVAELATDENGELTSAAPRVFSAANVVVMEIVKSGTVEIENEQVTIEDALKLKILDLGVKSQIINQVAESIQAKKQTVIDYVKEKTKRRTAPHEAVTPSNNHIDYFEGEIPTHSATCSGHKELKDNFICKVFNAGFELKCGCKYQLLVGQETFVCIETNGKPVKY